MGGKQKKVTPVSDNLKNTGQEKGDIKDHECSLIYETKMERNQSTDLNGFDTKVIKFNRLEEINIRYNGSRLGKIAFFECLKKVEKLITDQKTIEKSYLRVQGTKNVKKQNFSDSTEGAIQKNESFSHTERVHKLNKENTEKANGFLIQEPNNKGKGLECYYQYRGSSVQNREEDTVDGNSQWIKDKEEREESKSLEGGKRLDGQDASAEERQEEEDGEAEEEEEEKDAATVSQNEDERHGDGDPSQSQGQDGLPQRYKGNEKVKGKESARTDSQNTEQNCQFEHSISSKLRVNEEGFMKDDNKESRVDTESAGDKQEPEAIKPNAPQELESADSTGTESETHAEASIEDDDSVALNDDSQTLPAPFDHRIVSAKSAGISSYYYVNKKDVLGQGRFGQVHKCKEKATGLQLAAKIIKARGSKEKNEVKNEINVMNQLNHVNLIQLYDAFESKNDIVLVMEYVEGGELFDRIIDENCNLTELDTISFIKQICEGIQHMHQMYILHLDLKPENILCVNRDTYQIKIIDFGLARRYQPREKLKVNFGTPEFLAPEVVNYDFVSFPTDMWSVGVIAYMLLSGLSPFLGDDDNETLNNILACNWEFEEEEFQEVSEDAKDFISKLLIKEKCWRMSATSALKHPWLLNQTLHCRLQNQEKAKCSSESQAPMDQ
ncbi:myosin light chain kinase family member 4 [Alligator mississippiensis]|uniref:myosin light chain kinase family member 4 n=1 Tax=Alligator mississippiensis TaxID=8496 RepID=UPI000711C9BD|nr:myosin light chain kinase family member 4 [Alligator mississippiensis]